MKVLNSDVLNHSKKYGTPQSADYETLLTSGCGYL